jgi:hypothetical protein
VRLPSALPRQALLESAHDKPASSGTAPVGMYELPTLHSDRASSSIAEGKFIIEKAKVIKVGANRAAQSRTQERAAPCAQAYHVFFFAGGQLVKDQPFAEAAELWQRTRPSSFRRPTRAGLYHNSRGAVRSPRCGGDAVHLYIRGSWLCRGLWSLDPFPPSSHGSQRAGGWELCTLTCLG